MSASQKKRVNALGGILRRMNNFDPTAFQSDFNSRLTLQKTVYLMQEFGLNLGYYFSWYLRGPYCPVLTRDAYELAKTYTGVIPVKFAESPMEKRFCEFITFIKPIVKNHEHLERIASIHFLFTAYPYLHSREIFAKIKRKIPKITINEFTEAKKLLRSYGLLESDKH